MDFGALPPEINSAWPAAVAATLMACPPCDACRSAQYRLCPHPGELVRRVMTTHPASVNADSTAGERRVSDRRTVRWSALEGMRLEAGATETVSLVKSATSHRFTDSSTESVISALGSSAYNRSPRLTRRPTTRRRIDIDALRRYAGRSLAAHCRRQHMEIHRNGTAA